MARSRGGEACQHSLSLMRWQPQTGASSPALRQSLLLSLGARPSTLWFQRKMLTLNILKYQTKTLMYAMSLLNVRFLIKGSHLSTFKNVCRVLWWFVLSFFFFFRSLVIILGLGGAESMWNAILLQKSLKIRIQVVKTDLKDWNVACWH